MNKRRASCSCGKLSVECEGEPVRISMCSCLECQRRTGSVFGVQARWLKQSVQISGDATEYARTGDEGHVIRFRFCPGCGTTLYWTIDDDPERVAVAVGAFADPSFPPPKIAVYENRRAPWTAMPSLKLEPIE